jgi:heme/copper-type cytochrome/quinol oxidase subunit 2
MMIVGAVLALIGWLLSISWLVTVGIVLLVIGAILYLVSRSGSGAGGGRRHYY